VPRVPRIGRTEGAIEETTFAKAASRELGCYCYASCICFCAGGEASGHGRALLRLGPATRRHPHSHRTFSSKISCSTAHSRPHPPVNHPLPPSWCHVQLYCGTSTNHLNECVYLWFFNSRIVEWQAQQRPGGGERYYWGTTTIRMQAS
jgi:hypothetical protein